MPTLALYGSSNERNVVGIQELVDGVWDSCSTFYVGQKHSDAKRPHVTTSTCRYRRPVPATMPSLQLTAIGVVFVESQPLIRLSSLLFFRSPGRQMIHTLPGTNNGLFRQYTNTLFIAFVLINTGGPFSLCFFVKGAFWG